MNILKSLSVQSRLLAAFVLLTLLAIGVTSAIGYVGARNSLKASTERQLAGLQRSKTATVRNMLVSARRDIVVFSASSVAIEAARDFLGAYRRLGTVAVTPGMDQAVLQFYADDFVPALARRVGGQHDVQSLVPGTPTGKYLHYHYLAQGHGSYDPSRVMASTSDRSDYGATLQRLQPEIGALVQRLGLDNVLLVDPQSMDVFYSYRQSTLLGTNLLDGPYASSNVATLAQMLRNSKDPDDYRFADFEAYRPALGSPKAFIGTPVFDGGKMLAIMVLRFPIEAIQNALSGDRHWEAEGLGKSGEVYLLGPDLTMRTDARFLQENPKEFLAGLGKTKLTADTANQVRRLGTTILTVPVKHAAARAALNGQTGLIEVEDYRGVPVMMAYGPLDLDSVRWGVIAKVDESEAMAPLRDYARRAVATAVGLSLLSAFAAMLLATAITRPLANLVQAARRVGQGELDVQVPVAGADEFHALGTAFNEMVANLRAGRAELDHQVRENEHLLSSLLPAAGAAQYREAGAGQDARQSFADVTVAFVNIIGLDVLSREIGDDRAMALLNDVVAALDEAAEHLGVEKVRSIGSSYLAASGLAIERPDHTARMVEFAREAVRIINRFNAERGVHLVAEIGINAGPVIGGMIGRRRFMFDLWGDTVKLAKGIGTDGKTSILVTRPVYDRVRDLVAFGPVARTEIQGMGAVDLYPVADGSAS